MLIRGTIAANSAEAISFVKNTDITADNFQLKFKFDNGGAWRAQRRGGVLQGRPGQRQRQQRRALYRIQRARREWRRLRPERRARRRTIRYTYLNNGGTLPSFQLVGNQDLFTNPDNGFFKSHWAFADTTEAENWAVRGDVQFDPPFIESGGVTFSGGLRLANREIDYEFGRFLADYSGQGELNGSTFGQNWTPFGYFQDGAIGYKSCEIPASAGANFQFAPCERFGNSPALITPYQTFTGSAGRVETINGFWAQRPHHRQRRAGAEPLADEQCAGSGSSRCIRTRSSRSSLRRWKRSASKRRRRRPT